MRNRVPTARTESKQENGMLPYCAHQNIHNSPAPWRRAVGIVQVMVYRGAKPREAKGVRSARMSTLEEKLRRHKNKKRIWRRCVARLAQIDIDTVNLNAASLEVAS